MRILKIWDAEYPWDVRAEKVMRSLTKAGHEVHLVARNRDGRPLEERLPEAVVHRLRPWSVLGSALDSASQFPAFVNPRWIRHINRTAGRCRADGIIVRDLPLAPTAIGVARWRGIPAVLDMAENYPAMIRDIWSSGRKGPLDWAVRNPRMVAAIERWVVKRVDHILVVVEESAQRLEDLGVSPDRITVVCNTPWPDRIPDGSLPDREPTRTPRLVYLGLLEQPRGLSAVLEGLAALRQEGIDTELEIIGGGRDSEDFRAEAGRLGLTGPRARFHGVLEYEDALDVISGSDIGVVPHMAVESWHTTIPNKLFDYMSRGLPVITSDAKPAARIVTEEECGVVFRSGDPGDFGRAVKELLEPEIRARMGARGRAAVHSRYNWSHDEDRLLETVQRVLGTPDHPEPKAHPGVARTQHLSRKKDE